MGRRLEALRTATDLVSGVRSLRSVRQEEGEIAIPFVILGTVLGFSHRLLKREYVGSYRENPVGSLVFTLLTFAVTFVGTRTLDDDSTRRSVFAGLRFGSFAHRSLDLLRDE